MSVEIYELFVEVRAGSKNTLLKDVKGAYVCCYVSAKKIEDAIQLTKDWLLNDAFQLLDIQQVVRISLDEWRPYEDGYPVKKELEKLFKDECVIYGPFDCYESEWEH